MSEKINKCKHGVEFYKAGQAITQEMDACVECDRASDEASKNVHAVALGRLGGLARAKSLSKIERIELGRRAANARWHKKEPEKIEFKLV